MPILHTRFRLTHKVAAIGIAGMLGLAALVAIYWTGTHRQEQYVQALAEAEKLLILSADLNAELLQSRRFEKDFLLRGDMRYVELHADLAKSIGTKLDSLENKAGAVRLSAILDQAVKVRAAFKTYLERFGAVVRLRSDLGLKEELGLEGNLRTAVRSVESTLVETAQPRLTLLVLMMRRHEKDFMLRRDTKYGDEMKARLIEFVTALDATDLSDAAKRSLRTKMEEYQRNFFAWMDAALKLGEELKAMSDVYSVMEPDIDAMMKSVRDFYATSSSASENVTAQTKQQIILAAGLIAAAMLTISLLLGRAISKPLGAITKRMLSLAQGDLQADLPGIGRKDEIGAMADALLIFKQQAIEKNRLVELQEAGRRNAVEVRKQAMLDMANVVEGETTTAVNAVGDTAQDVRLAAEEMSEFAMAVSVDTQSVAAASEQALVSAQTVSAAAEELTASIREINAQVSRTSDVARQAVSSGEKATATVRSLTDAISRISDVTKLIGNIASQTNLLALNATIEAARAGEAGRGFAVVAAEVKNLASQTARSTEDINRQVAEIQTVSASAVDAMSDVGVRIGEIDEATSAILTAIEQQSAATQEITRNITETASSAREVSAKIQNVSAGATKVGDQAQNVRQSIGEITDNITGLRAVLVRVVRTSTEDADRRRSQRYPLKVAAEVLDVSGKRRSAEVVDISQFGARIGCSAAMQEGDQGNLRLEGVVSLLPFVVRARRSDMLHVEFAIGEEQAAGFLKWFNHRVIAAQQALAS